jgi:LCP family protein required for cell wall assembly
MLSLPRDLIVAGGSNVRLNAAFAGGPAKLIARLRELLSVPDETFEIHHYVSIRFSAFAAAVNSFGCFYSDIDRKYFNDNSVPGADRYAAIDVQAGYQRLCGEDSLDYVRFRHLDNDIVREARQQHFLSEARGQVATSRLISERDELSKTILKFVDTDIRTPRGILGVAGLAIDVVGRPTKRIQLNTTDTAEGALQTTSADLAKAAKQFLHPPTPRKVKAAENDPQPRRSSGSTRSRSTRKATRKTPATLSTATAAAKRTVQASGIAENFSAAPIYIPKLMVTQGAYRDADSRGYDIASEGGRAFPWQGYRLVAAVGGSRGFGQYYGIQGTSWKSPPVLDLATDEVRLAGRTYRVQYDGARIRRLLWSTPNGTYWVNNSLKNSLTNSEMRAIARSLVPYRP